MRKGRMTQKGAILLAGALGGTILIMLFPLWKTMAWSDPVERQVKENVTGAAVSEEVTSGSAISGGAISSSAISGGAIGVEENGVIVAQGTSLETRIQTPAGYEREAAEKNSLTTFLRTYQLRKDKAKVKLFNGKNKDNQENHVAILKLPLDKTNLQQATSSVQRVVAEYLWKQGEYTEISFQLGNGFQADYVRWREGYRIAHGTTGSSWVDQGAYDESYDTFCKYLQAVFLKTSSATLLKESEKTTLSKLDVGDVFVKSGHVVMVVDVCQNSQGKKAFLLARGGTPAQQFHVIKNPAHPADPWYYEEEISHSLKTPDCEFPQGSSRTLKYIS